MTNVLDTIRDLSAPYVVFGCQLEIVQGVDRFEILPSARDGRLNLAGNRGDEWERVNVGESDNGIGGLLTTSQRTPRSILVLLLKCARQDLEEYDHDLDL